VPITPAPVIKTRIDSSYYAAKDSIGVLRRRSDPALSFPGTNGGLLSPLRFSVHAELGEAFLGFSGAITFTLHPVSPALNLKPGAFNRSLPPSTYTAGVD